MIGDEDYTSENIDIETQYERAPTSREKPIPHYYGDVVRGLLLVAGITLLISIPFDRDLLAFNLVIGIIIVLVLTVFAGLTTPRNSVTMAINVVISAILFLLFEYFSIAAYNKFGTVFDLIYAFRQIIAFCALLALYFGIKSLRRMASERRFVNKG